MEFLFQVAHLQTRYCMIGVILCGGKGSRMGIRKEDLLFGDSTLANYQAKKMLNVFDKVFF
ncbi:hypothetical protein NHP164001_09960 [Helicobacter trogontum]|uniref:MobA-like NTP transferase domain-containing protein n=1 Tax=Helicobacter trogontum TaxID=50960 RepID=A0ABQ0D3T3_9HELI